MMKNLMIETLMIEGTRRCNMKCAHCLRGDAECIDIKFEYVKRILDKVGTNGAIYNISFGGGEPSLNIFIMKATLEYCKKNNIQVNSFWTCTNGKIYNQTFIDICVEWIIYCSDNIYDEFTTIDNISNVKLYSECSGVSISMDKYHEPIPTINYLKLQSLSFFDDCKITPDIDKHLINMGKAKLLDTEYSKENIEVVDFYGTISEDEIICEQIYLSATGNILGSCNISYEEQLNFSIANIMDENWLEILEKEIEEI